MMLVKCYYDQVFGMVKGKLLFNWEELNWYVVYFDMLLWISFDGFVVGLYEGNIWVCLEIWKEWVCYCGMVEKFQVEIVCFKEVVWVGLLDVVKVVVVDLIIVCKNCYDDFKVFVVGG